MLEINKKKTRFHKKDKSEIFLHKTGKENELEQSRFFFFFIPALQ